MYKLHYKLFSVIGEIAMRFSLSFSPSIRHPALIHISLLPIRCWLSSNFCSFQLWFLDTMNGAHHKGHTLLETERGWDESKQECYKMTMATDNNNDDDDIESNRNVNQFISRCFFFFFFWCTSFAVRNKRMKNKMFSMRFDYPAKTYNREWISRHHFHSSPNRTSEFSLVSYSIFWFSFVNSFFGIFDTLCSVFTIHSIHICCIHCGCDIWHHNKTIATSDTTECVRTIYKR